MQNALNAVSRYFMNVARTVERDWNAFWYTPADPTLLGVLRILTGLMLVYTHAVWGLALNDFFGPTSWLSPALVRSIEAGQYTYSFWFWVPHAVDVAGVRAVDGRLCVLHARGSGHESRRCWRFSPRSRMPTACRPRLFGLDQINIMLTLYLAIGPSGQSPVARSLAAAAPAD